MRLAEVYICKQFDFVIVCNNFNNFPVLKVSYLRRWQQEPVRWYASSRPSFSQHIIKRKNLLVAFSLVAAGGYYYYSLDRVGRRRLRATASGFVRFIR
jgi:hypothetical protein